MAVLDPVVGPAADLLLFGIAELVHRGTVWKPNSARQREEAQLVRSIYERYLAIGSVHRLAAALIEEGIVSKRHVTCGGRALGGSSFGRGALFHLLRNRIYLGQIVHKELVHQGEHLPIVEAKLFDQVQQLLAHNRVIRSKAADRRTERAMLVGRLFDELGEPMVTTHPLWRSGGDSAEDGVERLVSCEAGGVDG